MNHTSLNFRDTNTTLQIPQKILKINLKKKKKKKINEKGFLYKKKKKKITKNRIKFLTSNFKGTFNQKKYVEDPKMVG